MNKEPQNRKKTNSRELFFGPIFKSIFQGSPPIKPNALMWMNVTKHVSSAASIVFAALITTVTILQDPSRALVIPVTSYLLMVMTVKMWMSALTTLLPAPITQFAEMSPEVTNATVLMVTKNKATSVLMSMSASLVIVTHVTILTVNVIIKHSV